MTARTEIAPPGASAMEEARRIATRWYIDDTDYDEFKGTIARALIAAERRGFKDAIDKTSPGWQALGTALRLIRDAVEELGPVGAVPSRDAGPPDAAADAMNIIAGIQAIDLAAERRGREAMREEAAVGKEIIEIMAEYDRQEAAHEYGTPGGLEHMGDVWNLLYGWRNRLVRALPIDPPQEKTMQERFNDGDMPPPQEKTDG